MKEIRKTIFPSPGKNIFDSKKTKQKDQRRRRRNKPKRINRRRKKRNKTKFQS